MQRGFLLLLLNALVFKLRQRIRNCVEKGQDLQRILRVKEELGQGEVLAGMFERHGVHELDELFQQNAQPLNI